MIQAALLIIATIGIPLHVTVVPALVRVAGRDAWVSEILAFPAAVLCWWLIVRIARMASDRPILEQVPYAWLRWPILLLLEGYVLLSTAKEVREWAEFSAIAILPSAPPTLLAAVFLIMAALIVRKGLQVVAVTIGFLLPIVILLGITNSLSTLPAKDYHVIFPVLEYGPLPALRGLLILLPVTGDFLLILFFVHFISTPRARTFLPWFLTMPIFLMIGVGLVAGLLAEYGPVELAHHRYPAFEGWRMVTFGPQFERLDFFAIYQWIVGLSGRAMLFLFVGSHAVENGKWPIVLLILLTFGSIILVGWPLSLENSETVNHLSSQIILGFEGAITVLVAVSLWIGRHSGAKESLK